ncbi:toxin glutamine deamidase domain-containing protein [Streptomyces sp. DSM 44915]|uniref:Toxin glutamine deamidase domain-containing protein n=1 Tax=Streptomyces chisholmiae TaxID=3075540 RepID=A0ABU2JY75_9ACTN|nr:toxin glutamine deamidase domain-containing protein [Streptomyces sp. DSM 44915]MDT0269153.1 toxin glutamine deamidase domain-containing protein [Streptomyces sp. DSM 44915]
MVLADTLIKYARGELGLLDVVFAALDCIPGLKGITTLGGLARGLRSGLAAPGAALRNAGSAVRRSGSSPGSSRAIHADSMSPADAQRFVDTNYPWLRDVNNTGQPGYTDNCSRCVVAVDRRLDGIEVGATPLQDAAWPDQRALGAEGMDYQPVNSYDDITQDLLRRGEGARSIVYISRPDTTAHVFNAVNTPRGVVYLDGQSGQLAQLEAGVSSITHLPYR